MSYDLAASGSKGATATGSLRQAFRAFVWPRRRLLTVGLGLIVVNRTSGLVLPACMQVLLDTVIPAKDGAALGWLVTGVVIAIAVQASSSFALTRLLSVQAQHLIAELRVAVQRHVLRLPLRYFDATKSGALVSRIMNDVEGVRNIVGTGLVQMVGGILTSIASLVILLNIDWLLTLVALLPVAVFGLVAGKAFAYIRPIFRTRGEIAAQVTGRLTETLGGIRIIKGFSAEDREEAVFAEGAMDMFRNVRRTLTATALVTSLATFLLGLAMVSIMGLGGSRIIAGQLTTGEFFAFTLYLGFLVAPVVQMANIGSQFTEALAGLDRMNELLAIPLEADDPSRDVALPAVRGDVRFTDVTFAYEPGTPVVQDVSFDAAAGSVTAFVGSSGSGKSTLAALVAGFVEPDTGTITIDGQDRRRVRLADYRRHLGLVLQDDFLFSGTIRANIRFGRPDATDAEVDAAVRGAYVHEFTDRFDDGLDTVIGERGVKLSGGQRQRVAIARALLADPRLLVLDEATSSLDTESEAFIQQSLEALMRGRTTFVIAHRLSTIRRADQILVIEDGRIVERGTHDALIAAQGRYHELFTYQARI